LRHGDGILFLPKAIFQLANANWPFGRSIGCIRLRHRACAYALSRVASQRKKAGCQRNR
jgi:hypothetical protein